MFLSFRKNVIFLLISGIILLHLTLIRIPNLTHVSFFNIGQGDSSFIFTKDLHTILIDGGPGEKVLEELGDVLPFFIHDIDLMVLTHPHSDHVEGLIEVLRRYNVHNILISGNKYESITYNTFLQLAKKDGNLHFAQSISDIQVGNILFDILYPIDLIAGEEYENANNASIVIKMTDLANKFAFKYMFTGDCEIECEDIILKNYNNDFLDIDILKVGHHGSRTASSKEFIEALSPKIAVIQSGVDNQYLHPHQETLDLFTSKNIQIRRNDLEGRIVY